MRKFWTPHYDNLVRRHYPSGDIDALALRIGVTRLAVKSRAKILGVQRKNARVLWTEKELAYLREHYADMSAEDIAKKVRHKVGGIYSKAKELGLRKSAAFRSRCGHTVASTEAAKAHQFKKGHTPANKGRRVEEYMSEEGLQVNLRTRYHKGHRPHNQREIGTERVHADGYVYIRIEEGCVPKHRYVWEQANGPIPENHVVMFRDGNRMNCDLSNLCLISRSTLGTIRAQRETPEQRRARVEKAAASLRKTIRRDKLRLHWGMKPLTNLVKRW